MYQDVDVRTFYHVSIWNWMFVAYEHEKKIHIFTALRMLLFLFSDIETWHVMSKYMADGARTAGCLNEIAIFLQPTKKNHTEAEKNLRESKRV